MPERDHWKQHPRHDTGWEAARIVGWHIYETWRDRGWGEEDAVKTAIGAAVAVYMAAVTRSETPPGSRLTREGIERFEANRDVDR